MHLEWQQPHDIEKVHALLPDFHCGIVHFEPTVGGPCYMAETLVYFVASAALGELCHSHGTF